jgi:carbonic anhydrase
MPSGNLRSITDGIRPACVKENGRETSRSSVESTIRASVADLQNNSSIIRDCQQISHLLLVRAIYDLDSGQLLRLE